MVNTVQRVGILRDLECPQRGIVEDVSNKTIAFPLEGLDLLVNYRQQLQDIYQNLRDSDVNYSVVELDQIELTHSDQPTNRFVIIAFKYGGLLHNKDLNGVVIGLIPKVLQSIIRNHQEAISRIEVVQIEHSWGTEAIRVFVKLTYNHTHKPSVEKNEKSYNQLSRLIGRLGQCVE